MVYRRFYRRKFRRIRPRRSYIRRIGKKQRLSRRRPVKAMNRALGFKRIGATGTILVNDGNGVGVNSGSWDFSLDMVANYGEFTSLFDNYKLNCVVIKFNWHTDASVNGETGEGCPIMHHYVDYNDSTAPLSLGEILTAGNHKQWMMNRASTKTIKVYPKPQSAMWRTGAATAYGPKKGWINSVYSDVKHKGWKFWIDGTNGATVGTGTQTIGRLSYTCTFYFQVKNVI